MICSRFGDLAEMGITSHYRQLERRHTFPANVWRFFVVRIKVSSCVSANPLSQHSKRRPNFVASNHFDADGNVHMVDVSAKSVTKRSATACSSIAMNEQAAQCIRGGQSRKGDVLAVARIAAVAATKWTPHLIPLCHAIAIESVQVEFQWTDLPASHAPNSTHQLTCRVTCSTTGKTGIEMEALTGASIATLTVYDMLKSVDRGMRIGPTHLERKTGGQSGDFHA